MAKLGVGIFMATPDVQVDKFGGSSGIRVFDKVPSDDEFGFDESFGVRRSGGMKSNDGKSVLPKGYIKYFIVGIQRTRFQVDLRRYFRQPANGRAYPDVSDDGFLGGLWRLDFSAKLLREAARHECVSRCNPPKSCREDYCRCNEQIGHCL